MKIGMVLGLIGGILSLLVGAIGYKASSTLGSAATLIGYNEGASNMAFYSMMAIILPIVGIVGSGISGKNASLGALLMAASALGTLWAFGPGVFSLICAVLLGVGAFLVYSDSKKGPYQQG
ncbi:MAG: hypothetical protein R3D56_10835 [Paracoccaceae bacterium]